jgi:hypothetical protein
LFFTSFVHAAEDEEIALDQLPEKVNDFLQHDLLRHGRILRAGKEVSASKECYVVTVKFDNGEVLDYYVRPDGSGYIRKEDESIGFLLKRVVAHIVLFLPLAIIAGASARWYAQIQTDGNFSFRTELCSAFLGSAAILVIVLYTLESLAASRHRDDLIVLVASIVWAGISALVIELIVRAVRSIRGRAIARRLRTVHLCFAILALLSISIIVDFVGIERKNDSNRNVALRSPPERYANGNQTDPDLEVSGSTHFFTDNR